jgi:hypothetical protein
MVLLLAPMTGWASIGGMVAKGSGTAKYLGFINVYRATLLVDAATEKAAVLDGSTSRCLQLQYEVAVKAEDFVLAADTVLARQHGADTLSRLRNDIERLHRAYTDVKAGDVYTMCYSASDRTTRLALNGVEQAAVPSAEFASLYFGIWLGPEKPLDQRLRNDLLGGR